MDFESPLEPVPSKHDKETENPASADPPSLTARQKEILRLVARGYTNREIGEQLDISVRTVEVHRFNLMRRLQVRNVAQLLRKLADEKIEFHDD